MSSTTSTATDRVLPWEKPRTTAAGRHPHLVLAWSLDETERLGEAIAIDKTTCIGRGGPLADDPAPRATPLRMRPGTTSPCPPIACSRISRLQVIAEPKGPELIEVRSIGRAVMRINGRPTAVGEARVGDVIEFHNAAVYLVTNRPPILPPITGELVNAFPFGAPDPFGLVGESEAAWQLRAALAFAASTDRHVLLLGESGSGKELAARSIHGLSSRRSKMLVSRNAATMPHSLLDAELFGNVKNYPNPGMPERAGLIGEADGSTLFLDEIGDLPESHQVHLLRVLDAEGEYQRLGEAKPRRSSFRLVAATNRPLDALKHDFLARFTHRVFIPGLAERREDIPLLLGSILSRVAHKNPTIAAKFFERRANQIAEPRLAPDLVARLLRHSFTHHVRELDRLAWLAIGTAPSDYIGLTPAVEAELRDSEESVANVTKVPSEIDREAVERALAENDRSPSRAAKALGLKNRYVLLRLLKKFGLSAAGNEGDGSDGGDGGDSST